MKTSTGETPVPPGDLPRDPVNPCLPQVTPEVQAEAYELLSSLVEQYAREERAQDDEVLRYAEEHDPIWKDSVTAAIAEKRRQQAIDDEARWKRNNELQAKCAGTCRGAADARASPAALAAHPHPP